MGNDSMKTCVCVLAGTKACEKCQNSNKKISTWTGGGSWTWRNNKENETITFKDKKKDKVDSHKKEYEYLCLFIDFLQTEKIIPSVRFQDEEDYLVLKHLIEKFVKGDYGVKPYTYDRVKNAWKNKYGDGWE